MSDGLWFSFQAWENTEKCISWVVTHTDIAHAFELWEKFKNTHKNCWKLKFFLLLDEQFNYADNYDIPPVLNHQSIKSFDRKVKNK